MEIQLTYLHVIYLNVNESSMCVLFTYFYLGFIIEGCSSF